MLSLLENGRREPKLSLIEALAAALAVPADELHAPPAAEPPGPARDRAGRGQRDPAAADLGLPPLRVGARVPSEVIEHILALHAELRRHRVKPTATPEEARSANADLRGMMRDRDNYFAEIEEAAAGALATVELLGRRAVAGHAAVGGQPSTASRCATRPTCRPRPGR